jgi:hypothetical protein
MTEDKKIKLVSLKKEELAKAGIPLSPNTLYQWHSSGKNPEIFVKIGKRLFIRLDRWREFIEKNTGFAVLMRMRQDKKGGRK